MQLLFPFRKPFKPRLVGGGSSMSEGLHVPVVPHTSATQPCQLPCQGGKVRAPPQHDSHSSDETGQFLSLFSDCWITYSNLQGLTQLRDKPLGR